MTGWYQKVWPVQRVLVLESINVASYHKTLLANYLHNDEIECYRNTTDTITRVNVIKVAVR